MTGTAAALSRIDVAAPSDSTPTRAEVDRFITSRNSRVPSLAVAGSTGAGRTATSEAGGGAVSGGLSGAVSTIAENSGLAALILNGAAMWIEPTRANSARTASSVAAAPTSTSPSVGCPVA